MTVAKYIMHMTILMLLINIHQCTQNFETFLNDMN